MIPLHGLLLWCGAAAVSVDPDLPQQETPVRAESDDGLFVFSSMQMVPSSLAVEVNYRGEPHRPPEGPHLPQPVVEEEERGGLPRPNTPSLPPGYDLLPGDGSWMFNSIEAKAKQGLPPTHVPRHAPVDMEPASSERVMAAPTPRPMKRARQGWKKRGQRRREKPTIRPEFKKVLENSLDYKNWLKLKQEFLRSNKMLFDQSAGLDDGIEQQSGNVPSRESAKASLLDAAKFPNFPNNAVSQGEDYARPQRETLDKQLHAAPAVYKVDGTLYRAPTTTSRRQPTHHASTTAQPKRRKKTRRPQPRPKKKWPTPTVSSLSLPSHGQPQMRYPEPTFAAPPSSHPPPLPPGYELIPIDQLTEEHEVVPWEELPGLMHQHNLSLPHIPLGPFPTPTPFSNIHSPPPLFTPRLPSSPSPYPYSPTTPRPHYSSSTPKYPHTYSTKAPFTAFSPTASTLHHHTPTPTTRYSAPPKVLGLPPPVSPDMAYPGLYSPPKYGISNYKTTAPSSTLPPPPPQKPKSIHFGTHFANVPKTYQQKTVTGFRYNPTTSSSLVSHTPRIPGPTPRVTTTLLGRWPPSPTHYTTLSPFFESTKLPVTVAHHQYVSSTPLYPPIRPHHPSSTLPPVHPYHSSRPVNPYHTPSPTRPPVATFHSHTTPRYHTTVQTQHFHNPTPSIAHHGRTKLAPVGELPSPMPTVLAPPNNPLPTYFDVATLVEPSPPPPPPRRQPPPVRQSLPQRQPPPQPAPPRQSLPQRLPPSLNMPSQNMQPPASSAAPPQPVPIFPDPVPQPPPTAPPPIRLRGTLRPSVESRAVFPSAVQSSPPTSIRTSAVAVLMPQPAVPNLSVDEFPSFPSRPGPGDTNSAGSPLTFTAPKPDPRVVAITTLRPDLATKENHNKHRSSTEKEHQRQTARLTPRPPRLQASNLRSQPPGGTEQLPQVQPNVPKSEKQDLEGFSSARGGNGRPDLPDTWTPNNDRVRVLTNDNNGNFFLEENLNKGDIPFKRDFVPESKQAPTVAPAVHQMPPQVLQQAISPALTKKPRSWPSSLKKTNVAVVETSKNGQLDQQFDGRNTVESTTFSTSKVRVSASSTAAPRSLEQMIRMMEQKMMEESETSLDNLKIAKGQKLLSAIREKVAAREQMDGEDMTVRNGGASHNSLDLQSASSQLELGSSDRNNVGTRKDDKSRKMAKLRSRRRKLTQRAKALAKALGDITEEEPYVVFPMDDVNTKEKSVDEIFSGNPGLTRISAYDFEAAMAAKEEQVKEAVFPIADLKSSIDDLASTMSKLSSTVHETTTKKDTESADKISELQREIAKLTETLANLQVSPSSSLRPTSAPPAPSPAPADNPASRPRDSVTAASLSEVKTWGGLADGRGEDNQLEIVEVFTVPSTTEQASQRVRTTFRPRAPTLAPLTRRVSSTTRRNSFFQNSVDSLLEISTKKHPTSSGDIQTFFGSASEDNFGQPDGGAISGLQTLNQRSDHDTTSGDHVLRGLFDKMRDAPHGVQGLFEKMREMHRQAEDKVVDLPTPEEEQERFELMQEQLRLRQVEQLRADEEDLREQQRRKLEMFNMLQGQEDKETRQLERKEQERRMEEMKRQMLQEQQSQQISNSWLRGENIPTRKQNDSPGVAVASITIENVDSPHDYEVTDNGIVRLRKPADPVEAPEYEYEYYEADPDDIKFPVGGTQQFYSQNSAHAALAADPLNQLSNKDLLMNLLRASNNFQNREFLDRLKTIVTGVEKEAKGSSVSQSPTSGQGFVSLVEGPHDEPMQGWAPSRPTLRTKSPRLSNSANSRPVWPSNNIFHVEPASTGDTFRPLRSPVRFPNRRIDTGMGEVSVVTGSERKKATRLSSFGMDPVSSNSKYSSYRPGQSRISEVLDTTSDQEFLVSTSMAMQGGSQAQPPPGAGYGSVTVFDRDTGTRAGQSYSSFTSGTATPVHGAEVFRLGSGVQLQQQNPAQKPGANYILPTYSSGRHGGEHQGDVYSDIRVEASKKNLLTLPTDPNKMYIKAAADKPEAEVILYPAGQLLSNTQPRAAGLDPMLMAGSDDVVAQHSPRDPPLYQLSSEMQEVLDRETAMFDPQAADTPPQGLLQTLIRSAKDDLKFGSQVISFLQENGR